MGPPLVDDHHHTFLDAIVTGMFQAFPALYALVELWLRLFASIVAPLGVAHLIWDEVSCRGKSTTELEYDFKQRRRLAISCLLTVASSVILTTDTYYVLAYGHEYGLTLLILATVLSLRSCNRHQLHLSATAIAFLLLVALYLVFHTGEARFGGPDVPDTIPEGLHYDDRNDLVRSIASHWPESSRTYSPETGATQWMPTGDSRTGLPFLIHKWSHDPVWNRVWLPTHDEEVIALDICFPPAGHDTSKPVIMVLHGLSGGSDEEYIKDLTHRRSNEGYTVAVMIARGLMDLPVRGWNVFHGARVDDVSIAAKTMRRALGPNQLLIGVGYSMGGIVISNYVARSGKACSFDAAMAVSGGLDMRKTLEFGRALRLWQPLLVEELRGTFVIGKFGERYRHRLSQDQMLALMRGSHISDIDEQAVVIYNGFNDLVHYYAEMSAMGDAKLGDVDAKDSNGSDDDFVGRIEDVSVPFCVLHALDDPLISWKTVAAKDGVMHPENLVRTGSGHLMMLLTKAGGHVGWPLGWLPHLEKWKWMSDAVKGFADAVVKAKGQ